MRNGNLIGQVVFGRYNGDIPVFQCPDISVFMCVPGDKPAGQPVVLLTPRVNPWLAWWCVEEGRAVSPETRETIADRSVGLLESERAVDRRRAVAVLVERAGVRPTAVPTVAPAAPAPRGFRAAPAASG